MKGSYIVNTEKNIDYKELQKHLSKNFDIYDIQPDLENPDAIIITTRKLEDDKIELLNKMVENYLGSEEDKLILLEKKALELEKGLQLLKNELTELKNGRNSV